MKYKNYIFDLYGTLVDIHTDENKASLWKKIAVYFSAQGAAYTGKEIKERYGALIDAETKKLRRKLSKKYPGITELLQGLRDAGKKVYLLSNAQTSFTYPEMKALGLTEYFDDIFFSSDLEVKKPSAKFYEALFEKHGLDKAESVMVGNDRFADVQGALDFGIEAIYLHTEQSTPFEGALPKGSVQVKNLEDILEI